MFRTLILFDAIFGTIAALAHSIAREIRAEGNVNLLSITSVTSLELTGLNLLVMGCPTQRHRMSLATEALLRHIPSESLRGVRVATFDTRHRRPRWLTGSAAHSLARRLRRMGGSLLLPPESFFLVAREGPLEAGERERAAAWARVVVERFWSAQPAPAKGRRKR